MIIIARSAIESFVKRNPLSAVSLNEWYAHTRVGDWRNLNELKKIYPSCDFIGHDRYVFNIGGNNFSLVAMIHFAKRTLYIRGIFTHAEYDVFNKNGRLINL